MAVSALKKITVKDVMKGKPDKEDVQVPVLNDDNTPVLDKEGKPVMRTIKVARAQDVCLIYGRAHSHEIGSTQYGKFVTFIGSFEARRIKDGEIFQSTRIIFPPIADGIAEETFLAAKKEDETAQVNFAFVIGVEPDTRGLEGFKFTCKPIQTGEHAHDPLAELRSSLAMNFAQALPAEVLTRIGLEVPGEAAKLIGSDKGKKAASADA
jgi:hypothetical protein